MVVFTNGCFDILHAGHVDLLARARALGDRLIVGINSDASVRSIKGPSRPVNSQDARRAVLLALESVDEVVIFDELTPERIITELEPDVLVKGGDWKPTEIIGADLVTSRGGRVVSIPLVDGYSTTAVIEKMQGIEEITTSGSTGSFIADSLNEHLRVSNSLLGQTETISTCGDLLVKTLKNGGKVLICGNGGSAADAQHFAAELTGRYETERTALPAIALTTDTSALTAIANDYDFERVFARQVEALARPGDLLIAISTSGNSPNVIAAVMSARTAGCKILGMTGETGKKLASLSDACYMSPSTRTARIQEAHITVIHVLCEMVDAAFQPAK